MPELTKYSICSVEREDMGVRWGWGGRKKEGIKRRRGERGRRRGEGRKKEERWHAPLTLY